MNIITCNALLDTDIDPYRSNVIFLLRFKTDFSDVTGKVWTVNGDTNISGEQAVFDGVGDYLDHTDHADFGFEAGAWTIEGFNYQGNESTERCLFDNRTATNEGIGIYSSGVVAGYERRLILTNNAAPISAPLTAQFSVDTLEHWAVCYYGDGTGKGFINGAEVWSVLDARTLASSSTALISTSYVFTQYFLGRNGGMRGTKGVARYSGSFTPPTRFIY